MLDERRFAGDVSRHAGRRALLLVLLLWTAAFALACRLAGLPETEGEQGKAFFARLFGNVRFEISAQFYEQADRVFHKGIGHYKPVAFQDWFVRMRKEVAPGGHLHLHGENVLEIMPWLYFAARANPGNAEAWIVASYWLAKEGGRPDLAERVMNEALRHNPADYRLYLEKGCLFLKTEQYRKAERFLDKALAVLPAADQSDKEQTRIDLAQILTYRGFLYEINRAPENALLCYAEVTRMFPGRTQLKERMAALEKHGRAPVPPEELVRTILLQPRHVCTEEEHAETGH